MVEAPGAVAVRDASADADGPRREEPPPTFASRIRILREAKRWTQAELARRTGISRTYLHGIESGLNREPSARTIGLLAQALDVHVFDLMHACDALPLDYAQRPIQTDLELTMYLRRQRKLSEGFVNTLMRLIHLAELDEHDGAAEARQ